MVSMRLMTAVTSWPPWMQASTRSSLALAVAAPAPAEADGEEGAEGTGPWSLRW
uniref:Uncharacterized protein n=1 Tax=Arundo donax TaxID=35708 RepID=A0A0A8ZA37_ARUDO